MDWIQRYIKPYLFTFQWNVWLWWVDECVDSICGWLIMLGWWWLCDIIWDWLMVTGWWMIVLTLFVDDWWWWGDDCVDIMCSRLIMMGVMIVLTLCVTDGDVVMVIVLTLFVADWWWWGDDCVEIVCGWLIVTGGDDCVDIICGRLKVIHISKVREMSWTTEKVNTCCPQGYSERGMRGGRKGDWSVKWHFVNGYVS